MSEDFSKSLGKFFIKVFENKPSDSTAMIDADLNKEITYGQTLRLSTKFAIALKHLGLQKHDTIAIAASNSWKYIISTISSFFIGTQLNIVNPNFTASELEHIFSISRPELVICSKESIEQILFLKQQFGFSKGIVVLDDFDSEDVANFDNLMQRVQDDSNFDIAEVQPERDTALIPMSSGTTGLPKGVLITHTGLQTVIYHKSHPPFDFSESETLLGYLPFYHIWGLQAALAAIVHGTKLIILSKFKPTTFLEAISKHKVSILFTVPPTLFFLATYPSVESYDLSSLKDVCGAAAVIKQDLLLSVKKRLKIPSVRQGYGLTEACTVVTMMPKETEKPNSVGKPLFYFTLKIADINTGKSLGPNQNGELCVKSPSVMSGYLSNEKDTLAAFDNEGFLKTGDLAYYDEENFVYIVDRIKDIIKYKAFQVSPTEIENLLVKHSLIKDAAVVGISDETAGEVARAFIVKEPNTNITEDEIIKYVKENISSNKHLYGGVKFVDEIPKNPTGKILKRELRKIV